jgi:lysophospholipase L1-like esterase
MKKLLVLFLAGIILSAVPGCEDDGSLGDGHDFGSNDPNRYLVMGDSISEGGSFSWPSRLSGMLGKEVVNMARGGEMAVEGRGRVDGLLARYQPGYLLIYYGANDVIMGVSSTRLVDSLRYMVQAAKASQTIPVVATLTPMTDVHSIFDGGVDAVNPMIVQMCGEEGCAVVRLDQAFGDGAGYLQSDGLHPNDAGQQLIADSFYDVLK